MTVEAGEERCAECGQPERDYNHQWQEPGNDPRVHAFVRPVPESVPLPDEGPLFAFDGVLARDDCAEWTQATADEATDAILEFFHEHGWGYGGSIGIPSPRAGESVPAAEGEGAP